MQNIYYKKSKQCFTCIVLLLIMLMSLSGHEAKAALWITESENGYGITCVGETKIYTLHYPVSEVIYSWSITPIGQNTMTLLSNYEVKIQWLEANIITGFQISVQGDDGTSGSYWVTVIDALHPVITTNSMVGCQLGLVKDNDFGVIIDDGDGCINVCENSMVNYHATNMFPFYNFSNKFEWTVTGGVFYPSGLTSLTNSTFYQNPLADVTVIWGAAGAGNLTVKVFCEFDCDAVEKSVCIKKIETPTSFFIMDMLPLDYSPDKCYNICLNQKVNFTDLSTANTISPIISHQWDFGDNSYSQLQNPSHQYTNPGNYIVTLTVTNNCGCTSVFIREICVSEQEGLTINCPSVVCENKYAIYSTTTNCHPYTWSVTGGQIVSQADPEVTILWDNIGPDGFGTVSLDGIDCDEVCPAITTIKVPVIQATGIIDGPADICVNKQYTYKLPAWPATNFTWTLSNNNAFFASFSQNSHEVIIKGDHSGVVTLKCTYVNTIVECSGEAFIDIIVSDQPVFINPPAEICKYIAGLNLTLNTNVAPAQPIAWTVTGPGSTYYQNGVAGSSAVTFAPSVFTLPGTYIIKAAYPSGFCDPNPITIKVKDLPPPPTSITGDASVCLGYPYTYTANLLSGTIVKWTVTGGTITGSNIGNSVTVNWTGSGSITASRTWENLPGCTSPGVSKDITPIAMTGAITVATSPVCEDGTAYVSVNTSFPPETYEWSVFPATAGSFGLAGQGTAATSIIFNHIGTTNVTISCVVVKCGLPTTISIVVPVKATPTYSLTASPNPLCSGTIPVFNLSSNVAGTPLAGAAYNWDFGDGSGGTTAPSATSHIYYNYSGSNSTYPVTLSITNGGCGSGIQTISSSVDVKPSPVVNISPGGEQIICTNLGIPVPYNILLTSSVSGSVTYQWYYNNNPISSATSNTLSLTETSLTVNGNYYLEVTGSNNCTSKSNTFVLTYAPCASGPGCTPLGQWSVPVLTQDMPVICKEAHCTSVVTGSASNIWNYEWIAPNDPSYTGIVDPSNTMYSSKKYGFDKPGIYWVSEKIYYKDALDPSKACVKTGNIQVLIPLVTDFTMHLSCYNNNSYSLNLKDHSAKFYNQTYSSWNWYIDGSSTPNYTTQDVNNIFLTSGSHTIKLKVTMVGGHYCETTQTIVVPNLPVAGFDILTPTDPLSTPSALSSCSGNEVTFSNTSTLMTDLVKHVWNFGDGTQLHMKDGIRVYTTNNLQLYQVSLTVTDKYGCINTTMSTPDKRISIFKNSIAFNSLDDDAQYANTLQTICPGGVMQPFKPLISGGTPSYLYQWNSGINLYGAQQTAATLNNIQLNNVTATGTYWVKVTDAHGCFKNINPTPAKISIKNPPTANINGKQNVCFMDEFRLKAETGLAAGAATYAWTVMPGSLTYTTPEINLQGLPPGTYTITLSVTETATSCSSILTSYPVTIHNLPPKPTISVSPVDCNLYQLQLHASSSVSPGTYNWSDGQYGQTVDIFHGGAYRVWLTDQYGCQSNEDIDVALAPETYFWRFPTGCYTFCQEELPKWVDGPMSKVFDRWEWYFNGSGNIVTENGPYTNLGNGNVPYQGAGNYTITDRLLIDQPSNGMGSGEYTWLLDNGLCAQESGIMNIDINKECCKVEMMSVKINCKIGVGYQLELDINNNSMCNSAFYNLYIIDPVTMQSIVSITSQSPVNLIQGYNHITAAFPVIAALATSNTPIIIKVEVFCNSTEKCIGFIETTIPECKYKSTEFTPVTPANLESEYVSELNILPNPANTEINISYRFAGENTTKSRSIQIYDAIGKPVTEIKIAGAMGTYNLNVTNFAQGIYFVEIRENNQHLLIKRIIINH